jgi:hypothetical protein
VGEGGEGGEVVQFAGRGWRLYCCGVEQHMLIRLREELLMRKSIFFKTKRGFLLISHGLNGLKK